MTNLTLLLVLMFRYCAPKQTSVNHNLAVEHLTKYLFFDIRYFRFVGRNLLGILKSS